MSFLKIGGALAVLCLLSSCRSVHSEVDRKVDVTAFQHIYVERELSDGHHVADLLAQELRKLGYDASFGPLTLMPENTQAIIAYQTQWTFDFTTYLIELDVAVRDAKTGQEVAVGRYFHPALLAKNPAAIAAEVLEPIFKEKR